MSMDIAHFAFGAGMTSLVATFLLPTVPYPRTFVVGGGGWAMLPDVHWVAPVGSGSLRSFHDHSAWVDLFWFHRTLDRLDPADSRQVGAVLLAFFVVATLLSERRSYRAPELVHEVFGVSDSDTGGNSGGDG